MKYKLFIEDEVLNNRKNINKYDQFLVKANAISAWHVSHPKVGMCVFFGKDEDGTGYSLELSYKSAKHLVKTLQAVIDRNPNA